MLKHRLKYLSYGMIILMLSLINTSAIAKEFKPVYFLSKFLLQAPTGMRSNGKIYVVVAVLVTILMGLFIYLISLDRKISKKEKESENFN